MATMNISLPDKLKEWVEAQVAEGRHSNVSDFVRDVLRREQQRADYTDYIQKAVDEGLASGFSEYDREATLNFARTGVKS